MWWGIGFALVLLVPLMSIYFFAAFRLRGATRSAPSAARDVLASAARSFLAYALQKVGIVAVLVFVGFHDEPVGLHLLWMSLCVVLPMLPWQKPIVSE